MKLSFITDEATQNFDEAIGFALQHGLQGLELRSVDNMPIDRIDPDTLHNWKKKLDRAGLQVCNLASSFFKCRLGHDGTIETEMQKLQRLCDAADILGCPTIRGFAFFAEKSGPAVTDTVIEAFSAPASLLKRRGKKLLLESDPTVNTTNHAALASLLRQLGTEHIGAIFDPGNDIFDPAGEVPFPDGYRHIRPYLAHIHIKDAILRDGKPECLMVGTGLVDYPGLIRQLKSDRYAGWLSLETHYRKSAVLTEEQMRLPQGAAFSEGGMAAMTESAESLKKLLAAAD